MSLFVRPHAAADIEAEYPWYERQRPGLGDEFLGAVSAVFEVLSADVAGNASRRVRRWLHHSKGDIMRAALRSRRLLKARWSSDSSFTSIALSRSSANCAASLSQNSLP